MTTAPTDLASMLAEIKAKIYRNGVGAINAVTVQTVLADMLNLFAAINLATAKQAVDTEVAAVTPGLVTTVTGQANTALHDIIAQAATAAALAALQPFVDRATAAAAAALSYETTAQAILGSYLDDGVQGYGPASPGTDDGVQSISLTAAPALAGWPPGPAGPAGPAGLAGPAGPTGPAAATDDGVQS